MLDAANLLMPVVGLVAPKDPRWLSTLEAIGRELVTDSLVFRYNPSASPDGLPGEEGTFSLCSFFYVYALTTAGRLEEARYAFEKMLTYANHLGLYSEEIDPNGAQLGNFPQAFTHLALIQAATALDAASTTPATVCRSPWPDSGCRTRLPLPFLHGRRRRRGESEPDIPGPSGRIGSGLQGARTGGRPDCGAPRPLPVHRQLRRLEHERGHQRHRG